MCLYSTAQAQCVSSSCVIFYMHNVTEAPRQAALAQRDRKQDSGLLRMQQNWRKRRLYAVEMFKGSCYSNQESQEE